MTKNEKTLSGLATRRAEIEQELARLDGEIALLHGKMAQAELDRSFVGKWFRMRSDCNSYLLVDVVFKYGKKYVVCSGDQVIIPNDASVGIVQIKCERNVRIEDIGPEVTADYVGKLIGESLKTTADVARKLSRELGKMCMGKPYDTSRVYGEDPVDADD